MCAENDLNLTKYELNENENDNIECINIINCNNVTREINTAAAPTAKYCIYNIGKKRARPKEVKGDE